MKKGVAFALFAFALGAIMYSRKSGELPRGIRNNNPLNIRDNPDNKWDGLIGVDDKNFCRFDTPEMGYRAATKILMSYARRGIVTLRDVIHTWTPPNGVDADGNSYTNPTESYLRGVSEKTGISENEVIEPDYYPQLLKAMTYHENGINPYSDETIRNGVGLANG